MNEFAVLLLACPDRKGIVARVTHFIFERGGNISALDQHVDKDLNMLFMRIEWSLENFSIPSGDLADAFAPLAKEFNADWRIEFLNKNKKKVALMVSKHLHCLLDILWRGQMGELDCEFSLILSNHEDARSIAESHGVPFVYIPVNSSNKLEQEAKQIQILKEHGVELVVLARYMQILSENFVSEYKHRIINIHHSFLPAFMGGNPYKQALERGVKIIGATSHYATVDLDEGPIIEQDVTRISHRDSLEELKSKGRDLERMVLARAVRAHLEHRVLVFGTRTIVFER